MLKYWLLIIIFNYLKLKYNDEYFFGMIKVISQVILSFFIQTQSLNVFLILDIVENINLSY